MAYQDVFKRVEKKYILSDAQFSGLMDGLEGKMAIDGYGRHTISNIYFDTGDFDSIRTSLEKPVYKEKLRLRAYGLPTADSDVFVEIKKKYDGVVYKRRASMSLKNAEALLLGGQPPRRDSQILREIGYYMQLHRPKPAVLIAYDRIAMAGVEDGELRMTVDEDMRWRRDRLDLSLGSYGQPICTSPTRLLEIKIPGVMPLWLAGLLSELRIYPCSFSKYGTWYKNAMLGAYDEKTVKGSVNCA